VRPLDAWSAGKTCMIYAIGCTIAQALATARHAFGPLHVTRRAAQYAHSVGTVGMQCSAKLHAVLCMREQAGLSNRFRLPSDRLADREFVAHMEEANRYLASPSIIRLDTGRLLVLYEKWAAAPSHLIRTQH
jgi:hypothetical protein